MFEKLHRNAGLVFPAIATVLALLLSGLLNPYLAVVATSWIIYGLLGLSFAVIWGLGEFLSLAQTAFYGLGGYFGALIASALGYIVFYSRIGHCKARSCSIHSPVCRGR